MVGWDRVRATGTAWLGPNPGHFIPTCENGIWGLSKHGSNGYWFKRRLYVHGRFAALLLWFATSAEFTTKITAWPMKVIKLAKLLICQVWIAVKVRSTGKSKPISKQLCAVIPEFSVAVRAVHIAWIRKCVWSIAIPALALSSTS